MRISEFSFRAICAAALIGSVASLPARAFDPDKATNGDPQPHSILRYAYDALKAGRHADALDAFRHNADQNHVPSQWKLARMLQAGTAGDRDHLAAHALYSSIADRFVDQPPSAAERPYVSSAVIELGRYAMTGIKDSRIQRDPHVAEVHFYRAAALYGDANAQYLLAKLYASDALGASHPTRAARWLKRASAKGHARAQAELGEMLFNGEGVKQDRVLGLVYLARAAARDRTKRIRDLRDRAVERASETQRTAAARMLRRLNIIVGDDVAEADAPARVFGLTAGAEQPSE